MAHLPSIPSMTPRPVTEMETRLDGGVGNTTYAELVERASSYLTKEDLKVIQTAFEFADKAHQGQKRKSGEPFIIHPVEVAYILLDLHMDIDTITAALLHDTVEDSSTTLEEVAEKFSPEVAELVDGVTKISHLEIESLSESQANNLRKMLVAMSKDIRVIVIKLADRLHNMRTLRALPEDRRIFKARETMEIYAPLANRLGINSIKWELEDLAFYYLEPNKYQQISRMVAESRQAREEYLQKAIDALEQEFDKLGIEAKITGRPKHLYSIYKKMTSKGKDFSEIYDLIALRVIVEDVKTCYASLGAVHTLWHPMPGRFKDYIAMPKNNMYQSLHTTVIGPTGRPLEIQIRTQEMHQMAEFGVAAHWRYKEGNAKVDQKSSTFDEELDWLRRLIDWQDDTPDSKEFLDALKTDLFGSDVYVFTPKGEVVALRAGSTPIDFAYAIHTEVGNHCVGAKINNSIVPLSYELQLGDRVEILTQKNASPSRDWLNMVKTPSARSKIRSYFSKQSRDDDLTRGREMVAKEMRRHEIEFSAAQRTQAIKQVAKEMNFATPDDLYVSVGSGKSSARMVSNRLLKASLKLSESQAKTTELITSAGLTGDLSSIVQKPATVQHSHRNDDTSVVVKGVDDVLVKLSRCCSPVPGDDIIGFITRGRGVSVHRRDCPNAKDLMADPDRLIQVSWANSNTSSFLVDVIVISTNRSRLLQDVTSHLADRGCELVSFNANLQKDGFVEMRFSIEVGDVSQIRSILEDLRLIDGVFEARRVAPSDNLVKKKNRQQRS